MAPTTYRSIRHNATGALCSAGAPIPAGNGPVCRAGGSRRSIFVCCEHERQYGRRVLDRPKHRTRDRDRRLTVSVGAKPTSMKTDPGGNFLYVTNYASGQVAAFSIDGGCGHRWPPLSDRPSARAPVPLSIAIDPTGTLAYVANETGDSISAYSINPSTGTLAAVSGSPIASGSSAESVAVDPAGRYSLRGQCHEQEQIQQLFHYALERGGERGVDGRCRRLSLERRDRSGGSIRVRRQRAFQYVSVYSINAGSGALTPVAGSPFAAGGDPHAIAID